MFLILINLEFYDDVLADNIILVNNIISIDDIALVSDVYIFNLWRILRCVDLDFLEQ